MELVDANEMIESLGLPYFRELSTFGALRDDVIIDLLSRGTIKRLKKGEFIVRYCEEESGFQVVLQGKIAFYRRCEGRDVLTRYFNKGEQMGFDWMIGMVSQDGTDVAVEDSVILDISTTQFYDLHVDYPADFGLFMINLSRELSREIAILEDVIVKCTGGQQEALKQDKSDSALS